MNHTMVISVSLVKTVKTICTCYRISHEPTRIGKTGMVDSIQLSTQYEIRKVLIKHLI